MNAVLSNQPVTVKSQDMPKRVDHRYFYDENDPKLGRHVGYYTCGLAAKAIGTMLLAMSNLRFDEDFLKSLPQYINNPSVTGFMIEQAVLSSIALNGLDITSETNRPMEVNLFSDRFPDLRPGTENPVLHLPKISNFEAIDGVIVRKESGSKGQGRGRGGKVRLLIFPLQITVAKKHSDSHGKFFKNWKDWITGLDKFDVVPEFVWISENGGEAKKHPESPKWPEHIEWNIPLSQVNEFIGSFYKNVKQDQGIRD